jgi:glutathione S-transferase
VLQPEKFEPKDFVHEKLHLGREKVQAEGREMVEKAFAILDRQLAGHDYAVGNTFSIADAALFYVERWAPQKDIPLPSNLAAHLARMKARPAVKKVMETEGGS